MKLLETLAQQANDSGDLPFSATLLYNDSVIGMGMNTVKPQDDPAACGKQFDSRSHEPLWVC